MSVFWVLFLGTALGCQLPDCWRFCCIPGVRLFCRACAALYCLEALRIIFARSSWTMLYTHVRTPPPHTTTHHHPQGSTRLHSFVDLTLVLQWLPWKAVANTTAPRGGGECDAPGNAPSLTVPVLAAASDEALDSATLSFFVQHSMEVKKKEEEAEKKEEEAKRRKQEQRRRRQRRQELKPEFLALLDILEERRSAQQESRIHALIEILDRGKAEAAAASSSSQPGRRKRKNGRKRRTRRSLLSCSS